MAIKVLEENAPVRVCIDDCPFEAIDMVGILL